MCVICKQPFNPERKVNRHHWYLLSIILVEFAEDQPVDSAQEKN
jgi:hypothetical protein